MYHEKRTAASKRPDPALAAAEGYYTIRSLALRPGNTVAMGNDLAIEGEVQSPDRRTPTVSIGIVRADGTPVYGVDTDMDGVAPTRVAPDRFVLPRLPLLPGKYHVRAHAMDAEAMRLFDLVEADLTVTGETREHGLVGLAHRWAEQDAGSGGVTGGAAQDGSCPRYGSTS